jgi:hypothetical protein
MRGLLVSPFLLAPSKWVREQVHSICARPRAASCQQLHSSSYFS